MAIGLAKISGGRDAVKYHEGDFAYHAQTEKSQETSRDPAHGPKMPDEGFEAHTAWLGAGAQRLGLEGPVTEQDYTGVVLRHEHPAEKDGSGKPVHLGQRRREDGVKAHEICVHAPKSVSVAALYDARLMAAHDKANAEAMRWLETHTKIAIQSGGMAGRRGLAANPELTIATFRHLYSREQDAQLHTHNHLANFTFRDADGKYYALQAEHIYHLQKGIDRAYQVALERECRALGYETHTEKHTFELTAVSEKLREAVSNRSREMQSDKLVDEKRVEKELAKRLTALGLALEPRKTRDKGKVYDLAGVGDALSKANEAKLPADLRAIVSRERISIEQEFGAGYETRLQMAAAKVEEKLRSTALLKSFARAGIEAERTAKGYRVAGVDMSDLRPASLDTLPADLQKQAQAMRLTVERDVTFSVDQLSAKQKAQVKQFCAQTGRSKKAKLTREDVREIGEHKIIKAGLDKDLDRVKAAVDAAQNGWRPELHPQPSEGPAKERIYSLAHKETVDQTVARTIRTCFEHSSSVPLEKIVTFAHNTCAGRFSALEVEEAIKRNKDLIVRDDRNGRPLMTTRECLREEHRVIELLQDARACAPSIGQPTGEKAQRLMAKLAPDQRLAVDQLLGTQDKVAFLEGLPGTGKSTTLKALDAALDERGYKLRAYATTISASRIALRDKGFADATTLAALLTKDPDNLDLGHRDVLVVDELGMASMSDLQKLLELRQQMGFRLLCVGDTGQITPVSRGDGMRHALRQAKPLHLRLETIYRQRELGLREAVTHVAMGRTEKGLELLEQLENKPMQFADNDPLAKGPLAGRSQKVIEELKLTPEEQGREAALKKVIHSQKAAPKERKAAKAALKAERTERFAKHMGGAVKLHVRRLAYHETRKRELREQIEKGKVASVDTSELSEQLHKMDTEIPSLLLGTTNNDVHELNELCRAEFAKTGAIDRTKTQEYMSLRDLALKTEQRRDVANYAVGDVIKPSFGDLKDRFLEVLGVEDGQLKCRDSKNHTQTLFDVQKHADKITAYRQEKIELAVGDIVLTKGGSEKLAGTGERLENGTLTRVVGFTASGKVRLENGQTVDGERGHMRHGYAMTVHAAQGREAESVFLVASHKRAQQMLSREIFNVALSRATISAKIYTDDWGKFKEATVNTSHRMTSYETLEDGHPMTRHEHAQSRMQNPERDYASRCAQRKADAHREAGELTRE